MARWPAVTAGSAAILAARLKAGLAAIPPSTVIPHTPRIEIQGWPPLSLRDGLKGHQLFFFASRVPRLLTPIR